MAEVETVFMLGEGGSVIPMDLPLEPMVAQRVERGEIRRVNEDGSDYVEPAVAGMNAGAPALAAAGAAMAAAEPEAGPVDDAPAKPKPAEPKAVWVAYAESMGMDHDEADAMTKVQLIERFGK